jgi:Ankyrin repeats (many copies)
LERDRRQAASHFGHEQVVQLLLENGVDIDTQGGEYRNALEAAEIRGYEPNCPAAEIRLPTSPATMSLN